MSKEADGISLLLIENQWGFESRMRWKGVLQNAGLPSRCQESKLLSVLINGKPPEGADKMLSHHRGYHLIFDHVCGEQLYPAFKAGGLSARQGK